MRRGSVIGPLILIGIGGLFLLRNLWPEIPLVDIIAKYWPFVLIAWGGLRLIEILLAAVMSKPIPRNESAAARGLRASAGPSIYTIGLNSCGRSSSRVFSFDQFNFVGLDFLNALPDAERVGSILLPAQI